MTLSRRRVVGTTMSLAVASALAGCGDAPVESRDGTSTPVGSPRTFGPESLTVSFASVPDTVTVGGTVDVIAIARNRTTRPIVARLACPLAGLTTRFYDAQHQLVAADSVVCRPQLDDRTVTLAPGDSAVAAVSVTTPQTAAGILRAEAVYEAVGGRSVSVEHVIVLRPACRPVDPGRLVPALQVWVLDAVTGELTPTVPTLVVTDGSYRSPLVVGAPGHPLSVAPASWILPSERPGTYTLAVTAPGYQSWTRGNIVVTRGADCHVQEVDIVVRLARAP